MDFFQAQEDARKTTKWLGFGFFLSMVAVMLAVGGLIAFIFKANFLPPGTLFPWEVFGLAALGAGVSILVPFSFKSMQLAGGGDVVARDLGGRLLDGDPSDFYEQRLLNVVEEMALSSGVPVPMVYVMDHENSINAFAAGTEPTNAVIGVTRGCLERLTREELQGVVAHEFSHILNGDMKMNMRMIGWVFGLMAISMMGQMLFRSMHYGRISTNRDREGGNMVMVMFAIGAGLMVIGGLGVFFGRLLQAAISRQREYLADASAVQFTRNPETIAGALSKIGGLTKGSRIEAPKAAEASHMFFADGGLLSFGFATHPPLVDQIKRIKGDWDGEFESAELPPIHQGYGASQLDNTVSNLSGQSAPRPQAATPEEPEELHLPPEVEGLPQNLIRAAHDPAEAQLMIFSLLVASEGGLEGLESARLAEITDDPASFELVKGWSHEARAMHSLYKISLIDLATPTLRRLSNPCKKRFLAITRELISADREVSLFEYMMQRVIERHILRHAEGQSYSNVRYNRLQQIQAHADLLSQTMQSCEAHDSELDRQEIEALDQALNACEHASPKVKNKLIKQMRALALKDGQLSSREAELLRTIADAIGCAIPLGELVK